MRDVLSIADDLKTRQAKASYKQNAKLNKCIEDQALPIVYLANPASRLKLNTDKPDDLKLLASQFSCGQGKVSFL